MKTGFVAETFIVAYCHGCGDPYPADGEIGPALFRTAEEAAAYFADETLSTGWEFDGATLTCDGCLAAAHCAANGHEWSGWSWTHWFRDGVRHSLSRRHCEHCGIYEVETQP
ncbi:hypothetical protein [Nocardia arthritidis]|uniref:Uncharacterized protein n=1 Tax=Nocardia arthritidis TaxID=228602 RepID=A0A6G9Y873_9NOCA|nr:hypothetical protein [Nocardia arthritidis]QIS09287.1 hypothetical protein F5544_06885 [Nocardia arthritidis]